MNVLEKYKNNKPLSHCCGKLFNSVNKPWPNLAGQSKDP
jgi:hypothetical protein